LAFGPSAVSPSNVTFSKDAFGHTYPDYYYLRGQSTVQLPSGHTVERVVAHSVKRGDIERYIGHTKILDDPCSTPGAPAWARK